MNRTLLFSLALALLAGCAGNPKYACGLPEGVGCKPVSEVYDASITDILASTQARSHLAGHDEDKEDAMARSARPAVETASAPIVATVQPDDPLLTRPRHIRVWINRWEDATGDLHDETYLYLRLDNGSWQMSQ